MVKLEIDFSDIINNNIILSILASLIALLALYIDKCIFIKTDEQINYISYIKIFILVFLISFLILFIKEKINSEDIDIIDHNTEIELAHEAPF
tara:strand:- start:68 stop:346 length:279 start_codon:yes stop_codon:yes gene_type:complete